MMSINSGHARYFPRPTPTIVSPLERAITQLEKMIDAQRLSALPAPFALHKAKRILERCHKGKPLPDVDSRIGSIGFDVDDGLKSL
ncbi:hypothetical protein [Agrobacterium tumefaciens]|uniref:hypothetical protein n=1 Tax=Agrobacterium tumefaciens TaxID=358 RepID=UPI0027D7DC4F|nr:hypothetical protein [Agrobacterium tumefaciens]